MATIVLSDSSIWIAGYEITDAAGSLALDTQVDAPECTNFGSSGWREYLPGMKSATFGVEGYMDIGANLADDALFSRMGLGDQVISISPQGGAEGEIAYFARCTQGQYSVGGTLGEVAPFSLGAQADDTVVRGTVLHYGEETNTHNGTALQLGAAASRIYAALHVFSGTGDIDVKVQSDDNSGMTSPTDQITFTQVGTATARSFEWASASGAVADDYWRMTATFTGTRKWAVVLGII